MATSEKGNARNLANANRLNSYIAELGTLYNPSNPKLLLTNLQTIYSTAYSHQEDVNNALAPYTIAVDRREAVFAPLSKKITRLRKAYQATEGVTNAEMKDFMTIARRLKGIRKYVSKSETEANEEEKQHSTSQMSYDQRTNNMGLLISLLRNTPNYNPNEVAYQVATLELEKDEMLQATQEVTDTYIPLNIARTLRNESMYLSEDNLVDIFNKAKAYLSTILDTGSVQYKAISGLQFRKI